MFSGAEDEESESRRSVLLSQAEQVQHTVKERVEPPTWQAFWRIAVEGCSFRETADEIGNVVRSRVRGAQAVGRMLRAEGKCRFAQRCPGDRIHRALRCPELIRFPRIARQLTMHEKVGLSSLISTCPESEVPPCRKGKKKKTA